MDEQVLRQTAVELLTAIWQGIPADYKSRYRMNIWEQFENQVRSAAYTSNLGKFVNRICLKLGAEVGRFPSNLEIAETILNTGQDRALLKLMRDETILLVLMVRIENQKRREEWEAREVARQPIDLFDSHTMEEEEE